MGGEMSREEAVALAEFICLARPDWDKSQLIIALGNVRGRGTVWEVTHAAVMAAGNLANRKASVLTLDDGPHWRHVTAAVRTAPMNAADDKTCGTCLLPYGTCRARWGADHPFESVVETKRRAISKADVVPTIKHEEVMAGRQIDNVELPDA
jgi:hypothetical protein